MNFSVIDIIFTGLIGLFMIRCYLKGFVSELLSMAAIILGLLASLFFYKNGGEFLREQFWPGIKIIPEIAAFAALFIIVFIVVKLLEKMLVDIIDNISLSNANKYIGLAFGFAEGVVVVSLILFLLKIQPIFDPGSILNDSFFARILLPFITGTETLSGV
ncbi:MAG: CvpA family protein [Treponema sp.]|nr:CvpA family protein [Treponema sp.]